MSAEEGVTAEAAPSEVHITVMPLGARVLVRPTEVFVTKTASGLVSAKVDEGRPLTGVVEAVGDELDGKIGVGDIVLYGKYCGTEINPTPTETLLVIDKADLLCKIDRTTT